MRKVESCAEQFVRADSGKAGLLNSKWYPVPLHWVEFEY